MNLLNLLLYRLVITVCVFDYHVCVVVILRHYWGGGGASDGDLAKLFGSFYFSEYFLFYTADLVELVA